MFVTFNEGRLLLQQAATIPMEPRTGSAAAVLTASPLPMTGTGAVACLSCPAGCLASW